MVYHFLSADYWWPRTGNRRRLARVPRGKLQACGLRNNPTTVLQDYVPRSNDSLTLLAFMMGVSVVYEGTEKRGTFQLPNPAALSIVYTLHH
jgi:hypothetical protein